MEPASISKRFSEVLRETAIVNFTEKQGYPVLQDIQFLPEMQLLAEEEAVSMPHLQKAFTAMYKTHTTAVL